MGHCAAIEKDLWALHGRIVRYGYMTRRSKRWLEKQTDVWIAAEMVSGAARNEYDVAILLTADSDLVPAVHFVQGLGKVVELVTFPRSSPVISQLLSVAEARTTARKSYFRPYP